MPSFCRRWLAGTVALSALCIGISAQEQNVPAANPSRPTVTNPATLPPVGYLQFEQGYLGSFHSPAASSQNGVNFVAKIAVLPRLMLLAGTQPFATSAAAGQQSTTAAGAVQLGAQVVLFTPSVGSSAVETPTANSPSKSAAAAPAGAQKTPVPTISASYFHTVYGGATADTDLGSATNIFLLLFSGDVGPFHYDTNYIVNEEDGTGGTAANPHDLRRAQFAQTLSVNHSLWNPNLQLAVELYHFTQPLVSTTETGTPVARANAVDVLFAPSYQLRPNLVVDAGFSHGFTSTSTRWQAFAGFTYLLPHRLWPERKRPS